MSVCKSDCVGSNKVVPVPFPNRKTAANEVSYRCLTSSSKSLITLCEI